MGIFGKPNIGKMKEKGDVKGLIKALKDKDPDVSRRAKSALIEMGQTSVEPLEKALGDKDSDVRRGAAVALAEVASFFNF